MTNILYTINFLTNGGPTRVLQNIIKNIDMKKYKVGILTLIDQNDNEIINELKSMGVEIIELKYNKKMLQIIKNKNEIINTINDFNPMIIHTHGIVSTFICADKKVSGKKITTIHNNMFEDYKYTYGPLKGSIYSLIHIKKLKKFDYTVCCSKTSYDVLKDRLQNITYIRNGIDIKKIRNKKTIKQEIRKKINVKENDIVYVYGGVLNNRKRIIELIQLFKQNYEKNEFLLIVGDGPLIEKAKNESNSNIIFTGFKENIIEYFFASDIYISNSSSEGFSISVIEALSCGLLCFLSDIPSHKECFDINKSVYIGEYFCEKDFAEKKINLISHLRMQDEIKKELSNFQEKYLSSQAMADKYFHLYGNLVDNNIN